MKSIFLHVHADQGLDHRLTAAIDLARIHDGHISCVQIMPYSSYVVTDPFGGIYTQPQLLEALQERNDAEKTRVEERLASSGVKWDWIEGEGDVAHMLVDRGRLADVLILSRQDKARDDALAPLPIVSDVALHARAPVLVVPPGLDGFRASDGAVIAWNGSIEAAHSLRLTRSFLRHAKSVHILTVAEGDRDLAPEAAAEYLLRHGIRATLVQRQAEGRSIARTLLEATSELGAATLVMGAYGHSRLRETVLGGVTRDLLHESTVPLLLAH